MTIEQKAQRYDEAAKVIKRNLDALNEITETGVKVVNIQSIKNCFYRAFPELTESEDEKIISAIRKALESKVENLGNGVTRTACLAWLEKQGKQKTVDEIAKDVCKDKASAEAFLKSSGIMNEKGELAEQYRQDEQKPALSNDDERIRKAIYIYLDWLDSRNKDYQPKGDYTIRDMIAWLKRQTTPQVRTGIEWVNTIDDACDARYAEEYSHGEYCHEQSFKWGFEEGVEWLEKQGN